MPYPRHPYTRGLISAVPHPDPDVSMQFELTGELADPAHLPAGCPFHPRCAIAETACRSERPELRSLQGQRHAACHLATDAGLPT